MVKWPAQSDNDMLSTADDNSFTEKGVKGSFQSALRLLSQIGAKSDQNRDKVRARKYSISMSAMKMRYFIDVSPKQCSLCSYIV